MSYQQYLLEYGHLPKPPMKGAYKMWIEGAYEMWYDNECPECFRLAMENLLLAERSSDLRTWCKYVWRAKIAWNKYLSEQMFPLPLATTVLR